ncbi:1-phosphofructokinase [Companilactobacillus halodurans]|uniref:Tagatose-6-phosphate kinase n=1 Tax=Companilactobacillus halodurans TaxID=2584183 RepID=A0A5P0ZKX2_9LACO|nr:1-phosphofructokinase [Companilactobacillus halodurans]MQS74842.1 1-phosphofructokinase [Companilactobacillus halodurans]MQS97237.1 1-phosphofructokinase [Companilactobacillus halodurans]
MIYTCTLNPAIDLFIETDHLKPEVVNRTNSYDIQPNGKGVNVSFILKDLGIDNTALGVGGGFTSKFIEESLQKEGIKTDFTHIEGISRINVFTRVLENDTEFKQVNNGPEVSSQKEAEFLEKVAQIKKGDKLVVSGSFSKGIAPETIVKISQMAKEQDFDLIVDTSYPEVVKTLPQNPYLLKPNNEELASWFDEDGTSDLDTLVKYSKKLIAKGAQNILLSIGSKGALFVNKEQVLYGNAPKIKVVNTACSGDTMLGAFVAGIEQKLSLKDNLKRSIAAASSTASVSGLTDFSDVNVLMDQIKITEMEA